jgi:class 3 adenylate cyclase
MAVWREPLRGGFEVDVVARAGLDRVRSLTAADALLPPLFRLTGIRVTRVGPGAVTCSMPASLLMLDPGRWVDVFILAESTATLAAVTTVGSGADVRCAAMSIHHQRVATLESGSLVARAALVHSGRSHTLVEVSVEDGRGRPIMGAFASMVPAGASTAGDDPSVEPTWPTPDPWMRDYELPAARIFNVEFAELAKTDRTVLAPVLRELGVEFLDAEVGRQCLSMPASRWLADRPDRLDAGAIISLTGWALGVATGGLLPGGKTFAVIEHHAQFLRPVPADGERLVCQARVTHDVGDLCITSAEVMDAAGNTVATAGFTSIPRTLPSEPTPASERILATILFSDIVGSTQQAQQLGDADWQRLLATHHAIVRRQIDVFRGREVKTTGDGFVVLFDAPARAVQCATAMRRSLRDADIRIRVGLHTGECDVSDGDVSGIAVHAAARIQSTASSGDILVSQTVRDLTAGSGLVYEDAGDHELKGLTGPWRLFSVRA